MRVPIPEIQRVPFLSALRRDGYWITKEDSEIEATKPFGKKRYPRFHLRVYKEDEKGPPCMDLHIDWERPKHSQYWGKCSTEDNEAIREEVEHLKRLLFNS